MSLKFGKNEQHLIRHFGKGVYLDNDVDIVRDQMYKMLMVEAFMRNEQSPEAEALRKVWESFQERGWFEFSELEDLCSVE